MQLEKYHHLTIACTMTIISMLMWSTRAGLWRERSRLDTATIERLTGVKGE